MHHIVARHNDFLLFTFFAPFAQNCVELFLRLLLLIAKRSRLFEILRLDGSLFLNPDFFNFLLDLFNVRWTRHGINTGPRARFVHDIDCFVGQKAPGNVALGELYCSFKSFVREFGFVVRLVFGAQSLQNLNRLVNGRSVDFNSLEATFQRGVLFDVLAVLIHGGRANALQFTTA